MTFLTVNNTSGTAIDFPNTMTTGTGTGSVSNTLTLTSGKINNASPLTLGIATGTNGTLTGGSSSSYLIGEFRRWNASGTGITSRFFPVGSTSSYQPVNSVNFTASQTTGGVISAQFTTGSPGTAGLPLTDGSVSCENVSPSGYWTVNRVSGGGGTYTISVDASGFTKLDASPITLLSGVRLLKRATSINDWVNTDGTPSAPAALSTVTRAGCTAFSQFAIGGAFGVLPLELKSFTGKTDGSTNMLYWETLTERNVAWHVVERSLDNAKWAEVGRLEGQQQSDGSKKYELADHQPLAKAYYRLRSVDLDGSEEVSDAILLTRKGAGFGIEAAYPSPTSSALTVQFTALREETVTIRLVDLMGLTVLEQQFEAADGINEVPLQIAALQAGMYNVTIANELQTSAPLRVVKQ
jgi:hypothetical protein